jgi:DNA-binding LacI/PurR family transcriptional regulator
MREVIEFTPDRGRGGAPVYVQIYRHIRDLIERGRLEEGDYLPAERDLAAQLGVSPGTIMKAMRRLKAGGYVERRKGHGTRVLSAGIREERDRRAVLVLLGDIQHPFYAAIYSGIQAVLHERDYKPLLIETGDLCEREKAAILKHRDRVGGFLVVPAIDNSNQALYGELLSREIPFVFIDRYVSGFDVDAVVSDNVQGGYLATSHLLELGHRRIALVGLTGVVSQQHRLEGYRQALTEHDVPFDESLVYSREEAPYEDGQRMGSVILRDHPDVTAAFCLRDDIAWGFLNAVKDGGRVVPEEFSVVGYNDNREICSRLRPPLTTVRQPKVALGGRAARRMVQILSGEPVEEPKVLSLPVELVERESVGPAPDATTSSTRKGTGSESDPGSESVGSKADPKRRMS